MRVLCTLPNASGEINGVKFTRNESTGHMESAEIGDEAAFSAFLDIPGYEALDADGSSIPARSRGRRKEIVQEPEVSDAEPVQESSE